ncbi:MAG: XTP/dITP diphosphatase [Clostridia bacterium]|nr:XTP/dITP diphosphatase [Clostridia bacterium]
MDIVLASHNNKKARELCELLSEAGLTDMKVYSLSDVGFFDDIEENGTSFEENAMIKATALTRPGAAVIADDSGLCVDALDGAPGIYSARFSGEGANDEKNNARLLELLEGVNDRTARFVSVVACALPDGGRFTVRGECEGVILTSPRGENGFGYDPLFYIPSKHKTFAELPPDEKNAISHRGKAMRAFIARFKEETLK